MDNFHSLCQEFEKVPIFMTNTPSPEEIEGNPSLAALQALKYEEDTPVGTVKQSCYC